MTLNKYDDALKNYLESITVTETQAARIESALKRFSALMLTTYGDPEIYVQGSYATDTLVKPLSEAKSNGQPGEFDVDIVIERTSWEGAKASLESIENVIEENINMPMDTTKQSCVRVDYASESNGIGFHVDIVPTRLEDNNRQVPVRKNDEWKDSDAKQFADWFNSLCESKPQLRQVAVIMKRLRDRSEQTDNIKSILILTLAAECYTVNSSLMGEISSFLDDVCDFLQEAAPVIVNPVNRGENLMDTVGDYKEMRDFFLNSRSTLDDALSDGDGAALEALFGTGFKAPKQNNSVIAASPLRTPAKAYGIGE